MHLDRSNRVAPVDSAGGCYAVVKILEMLRSNTGSGGPVESVDIEGRPHTSKTPQTPLCYALDHSTSPS